MSDNTSAHQLVANDAQLKTIAFDKYSKVPSDDVIERAKKGLESKTHKVVVVNNKEEALAAIKNIVPKGASVYNAHSTTLEEIGFVDFLKTQNEWNNLHTPILAEQDQGKAADLRRQALAADYFFSSVTAVAETGEFTVCDLTGSRIGGFPAAKNVVVVIGANKIVPTVADCHTRQSEYAYALESARCRVVYKVPGSFISNSLTINGASPYAPGRYHFVIIKESLGY